MAMTGTNTASASAQIDKPVSAMEMQWRSLLTQAGIGIDANNPWDMRVNNPDVYERIMTQRSLGLGESYMDGWWDCSALDEFFYRLFQVKIQDISIPKFALALQWLTALLHNRQNIRRASVVAEKHYDLDNELFSLMLDETLSYSCGYWRNAATLHEAQLAKLDLICQKLQLEPGMRVLDIGCGWGSLAWYASTYCGVSVDGITLSKEQQRYAQQRCEKLPVTISLQDYREVEGKYDRIVSVGMFEHVGRKNYTTFMQIHDRLLHDNGLALLHTIGENVSTLTFDPWINKYIFPNGELPSLHQITGAAEGLFVIEDVHNFGLDYVKTLNAWDNNFCTNWQRIEAKYDERFYRMWRYYLNMCAAAFRARNLQLWQIVLSKPGMREKPYVAVR